MTHRVKSVFRDRVAFEEVWSINSEAVTSKVVGKELREVWLGEDRIAGEGTGDGVPGYY
jgi:hypothetical protein